MSNFKEICQVAAAQIFADRRTDMLKTMGSFGDGAYAPKIGQLCKQQALPLVSPAEHNATQREHCTELPAKLAGFRNPASF